MDAPSSNVIETVCGERITDPYRPLENLKNPKVQAWYKREADYARSVLDAIPGRSELIAKMVEFDKRRPEKIYNLSITDNDRYFYLKQTPADEVGKLFSRKGYKGKERLLFDPASYKDDSDGTFVISRVSPNIDGSKVVIGVSANGSEDAILFVMDVKNGQIWPERIDRCRFASPSWLPCGKAFYYTRMNSNDPLDKDRQKDSRVYLHLVGTDPSTDPEIFSRTHDPELKIKAEDIPYVSYDRKSRKLYAFVSSVDPRITAWYADDDAIGKASIPWKQLLRPEDEVYDFAATKHDLYLFTPKNAPRFKVLKTSLDHPDLATAETVIGEPVEGTLTALALTDDGLFYTISTNGVREDLYHLDYDGKKPEKIETPFEAGTMSISSKGFDEPELWAIMGGWNHDYRRYRYDVKRNRFIDETLSSKASYPEYDNLEVREVMVPSHDGVKVPLSLVFNRGMKIDGKTPVLIYGYGAYGNSITPFFSPSFLLWTHRGGMIAVAHVRGGGELGDDWHKAGMKSTKPNTWKDLIACAEYLIKKNYTSPQHIAINGGSAGGILIGRAMTARPDLFAAAMPQVGVLNALRGEFSPNGPVNVPEFGTVTNPDDCKALLEMDAYHHLRDGVKYPAALITAGMNDPRVPAWQPAKFAARLQEATASGKPVLFFTDYKAGHGIGDTKTKQFESLADMLSFGLWQTSGGKANK
ncbi:MAG TPA: S9 family peptidase [Chlorobaculum parvum]|uniref:prolyl oligopeptidase n=1 Tax=Chlorobaculum parvum TaxID=274539 RepID=A0A7C5HSM6_9CHLB|nr:S9 family peptidase [Chlorobaculum parvum]